MLYLVFIVCIYLVIYYLFGITTQFYLHKLVKGKGADFHREIWFNVLVGMSICSILLTILHCFFGIGILYEGVIVIIPFLYTIVHNRKEIIKYKPLNVNIYVLCFACLVSIICMAAYIPSAVHMKVPFSEDLYYIGSNIFDFEKHVGIVNSLIRYNGAVKHFSSPDLNLLYYFGIYYPVAFMSCIFQTKLMENLIGQFLVLTLIEVVLGWKIIDKVVSSKIVKKMGVILLFIGTTIVSGFPFPDKFIGQQGFNLMVAMTWTPQHMISIFIAFYSIVILSKEGSALYDKLLVYILMVFSINCSIYTVLYYLPFFVYYAYNHRDSILNQNNLRFIISILFLSGLALFANYKNLVVSFFKNETNAGSPFVLTDSFLQNIVVFCVPGGIATVSLLLIPFLWVKKEKGGINFRYICLSFLVPSLFLLCADFYSEIYSKMMLGQFLILILLSLFAIDFVNNKSKYICLIIMLVCAVPSGINSIRSTYVQIQYSVVGTKDEMELVNFVRHNTPITSTVSNFFDNQTVYDCQLERTAIASGEEPLPRLQKNFATSQDVDEFYQINKNILTGLLRSDYIYMSKVKSGLSTLIVFPQFYDRNLDILNKLGYRIIYENDAGIVAQNTFSTSLLNNYEDIVIR